MAELVKGPLSGFLVGLALKDPSKVPAAKDAVPGEESEADRQASQVADYVEQIVRAQMLADRKAGVPTTFVPQA